MGRLPFFGKSAVLFCSHADVIAALPCGLLVFTGPSFASAVLPVSRSGHSHAGCRAALCLVVPMLVLHCIGRIVILIALRAADDRTDRRALCSSSDPATIGARR